MKATLLLPFTVIYYLINILWDLYWRIKKPVKINSKVISVGNIAVGGSGKTTIAGYIAHRLLAKGKKVALVARGYGRPEKGPAVIYGGDDIDWRKCGDEPAALAKSIKGLSIYVDSNKTAAAIRAAKDGFEYIIIDDGFQHRGLYRDIDIVCLDGKHPFGNGLLLPSGRLREPKRSLKRADAIIVVDPPSDASLPGLNTSVPLFKANKKIIGTKSLDGIPIELKGKKVVGFCGLGNPDSFHESLAKTGCEIENFITFPDHYIYNHGDVVQINEGICNENAYGAVTTLKDLVKVEQFWDVANPLFCLEIAIELENDSEFLKLIEL